MGMKNAKFCAAFESVEKVAKNVMQKKLSGKRLQKNGVFYFYYSIPKFFG
jgi:hypothetical protein